MHIWTDSIQEEIWRWLRYFSKAANVHGILRQTPNASGHSGDRRSAFVAACVQQGEEYYRAAEATSLAVKPLPLFYGMEMLAKAVIAVRSDDTPDLRYHGLNTRPINNALREYRGDPGRWQIESEFAVVGPGVFPDLCRVIGDRVPPDKAVMLFKDAIASIPELGEIFRRHYGETPRSLYVNPETRLTGDPPYDVIFPTSSAAEVTAAFPEFAGYSQLSVDPIGYACPGSLNDIAAVVRGSVGGNYLVRRHATGIHSPISFAFIAMYILSNVVRYHPLAWLDTVEGSQSGSAALVDSMCYVAVRRFPHDVAEALWSEEMSFGMPGYLL
jgi:hypothetical protein